MWFPFTTADENALDSKIHTVSLKWDMGYLKLNIVIKMKKKIPLLTKNVASLFFSRSTRTGTSYFDTATSDGALLQRTEFAASR
jgi:hypothetical protein